MTPEVVSLVAGVIAALCAVGAAGAILWTAPSPSLAPALLAGSGLGLAGVGWLISVPRDPPMAPVVGYAAGVLFLAYAAIAVCGAATLLAAHRRH